MVAAVAERESHSLTDSSDFDSLPDAEPVELPEAPNTREDTTPDQKVCPTCGDPIIREPGTRGRLPKYHPNCRPSTRERLTGGTVARKAARDTKAAKEADEVIAMVKSQGVKLAMMVAMVDRFDGFCIMSSLPGICDNLRAVLIAHDNLRRDALRVNTGGSIVGLVFSVLTLAVPIAAHHGLIPSARITEMLIQLPIVMHKIAKRMKEGEQALADMMERAAEGMLKPETVSKEQGETNAAPTAS